jgi:hypothetical protein
LYDDIHYIPAPSTDLIGLSIDPDFRVVSRQGLYALSSMSEPGLTAA